MALSDWSEENKEIIKNALKTTEGREGFKEAFYDTVNISLEDYLTQTSESLGTDDLEKHVHKIVEDVSDILEIIYEKDEIKETKIDNPITTRLDILDL